MFKACNPYALLDVLQRVDAQLRLPVDDVSQCMRVLIVDSPSTVLGAVVGGGGKGKFHGHALLNSTGRWLKYLAVEHQLLVVMTSHTVQDGHHGLKTALGESWQYVADVRVFVREGVGSADAVEKTEHVMEVVKSSCSAAGAVAKYRILPLGIV